MERYLEMTGKTEEAAINAALDKLGLERDDVSVEILERAKSGFLGIGNSPAKVRVTYEGPDEPAPAPAPAAPAPARPPRRTESAKPPAQKRSDGPRRSRPDRDEEEILPFDPAKAEEITTFLTGLLSHMEINAVPSITYSERGVYEVVLEGQDLGMLIGRRGDTLDAVQQLTGYAVNRGARGRRTRIHIDAEGYRERREQALEALARKVAEKVVKYRKDMQLEPMNAYERHIIHTALQDFPGVATHSVGSEPSRRTVVTYAPDRQ